jgi:hypothetical protein
MAAASLSTIVRIVNVRLLLEKTDIVFAVFTRFRRRRNSNGRAYPLPVRRGRTEAFRGHVTSGAGLEPVDYSTGEMGRKGSVQPPQDLAAVQGRWPRASLSLSNDIHLHVLNNSYNRMCL